jgi:hypothetical protein
VAVPDPLSSFTLTDAERAALARAVGLLPGDPDVNTRLTKLKEQAFAEYVDWILGKHQPVSLTDIDAGRLLSIFIQIREEIPNRASLIDDFGIGAGRAASLVTRIRSSGARSLQILSIKSGIQELKPRIPSGKSKDADNQMLFLTPDIADILMRTASEIMLKPEEHASGKKWEAAEMPTTGTRTSYMQTVSIRNSMLKYVVGELETKLRDIEG